MVVISEDSFVAAYKCPHIRCTFYHASIETVLQVCTIHIDITYNTAMILAIAGHAGHIDTMVNSAIIHTSHDTAMIPPRLAIGHLDRTANNTIFKNLIF